MRKVGYCKSGYYINSTGSNVASDFATGFFHGFFSEGNNDGGIECFAVVEKLDGTVHAMSTARVKFLTPPNEEQGESPANNTQQTIPGSEASTQIEILYNELLLAVEEKVEGQSRHQTALKLIQGSQSNPKNGGQLLVS